MLKRFFRDETGLELSEYAVAAALVILVAAGAFSALGGSINTVIGSLQEAIEGGGAAAPAP
jgi:pilus assembly protein Flp/PilA